ncbi:MAG: hypothetical protein ACXWQO_05790 [Bdellovibrionota bacterium]
MGYFFKLGLPLILVAGLLVWAHSRSDTSCEMAGALKRNIPLASTWLLAAQSDPFLVPELEREPIRASLRQFQKAAAVVLGDFGLLRLSSEMKLQLKQLAEARDLQGAAEVLLSIRTEALSGTCTDTELPGNQARAFTAQVVAAQEDWVQAKRESAKNKVDFGVDREVYCQIDALKAELETVVKATRERCAARSPKARPCASEVNQSLVKELEDLEKKRSFNLSKLQRKWPAVIMEQLKCATSTS